MPVDRIIRVNERIRQVLGQSIYKIGTGEDIDTARLSFVSVSTAHDLRNAMVFVSVLGDAEEQARTFRWVKKHRIDFQSAIARDVQLKYTPRLSFRLTDAIGRGDEVLNILEHLDIPEGDDEMPVDPDSME